MVKVYFLSSNQNKIDEAQAILGDNYEVIGKKVDLEEIQTADSVEVVMKKIEKARRYFSADDLFFVEDTCLYLGEEKSIGPLIKFFPNERVVKAFSSEATEAVCTIGLSDGTILQGKITGVVVEPRGVNGFGWDPIFQPTGFKKTFAQMTAEEKNMVSMRRIALEKLREYLDANFRFDEEKLMQLRTEFENLRSSKEYEMKNEDLTGWLAISKDNQHLYPGQGLLLTPYDYLDIKNLVMLPPGALTKTLQLRRFFLSLFNHPYRISFLKQVNRVPFQPPPKITCLALEVAQKEGLSLTIGDFGAAVTGSIRERISRSERYASGPFVKLGKQARTVFVGSASPDVWNSTPAVATMAASHCLTGIPRNGLMSDVARQSDLAREILNYLEELADEILDKRLSVKEILNFWRNNVMGTLEASPEKALIRAEALWKAGIRTFRVYSPEPGTGVEKTVKALRENYAGEIEIFAGQIVDIVQAKRIAEAGADGLFVGIGGGGRCITGVRSGSVVGWPELVWNLRGEIDIPVIAEGGASDHIAVSLLLGSSGISLSRVAAGGTVESPGGALYCMDNAGKMFKPYGGEASARTKYLDGKVLPFDIPSFVEGETTKAEMSYVKFVYPTLTYNLHLLLEDAILAMVFRGVTDIAGLQQLDPSPLRRITPSGEFQRNTH